MFSNTSLFQSSVSFSGTLWFLPFHLCYPTIFLHHSFHFCFLLSITGTFCLHLTCVFTFVFPTLYPSVPPSHYLPIYFKIYLIYMSFSSPPSLSQFMSSWLFSFLVFWSTSSLSAFESYSASEHISSSVSPVSIFLSLSLLLSCCFFNSYCSASPDVVFSLSPWVLHYRHTRPGHAHLIAVQGPGHWVLHCVCPTHPLCLGVPQLPE